ncbi:MAG: phosphatidate cytidylyltransferase [Balneolaceae bacterium]
MSELQKRILFAIPAAILFIYLTWLGGWYFKSFIIFIAFFVQQEMIRLLDGSGNPPDMLFPYSIGLWVMLFPVLPFAFEIGLLILLLFVTLQTFHQTEESITQLSTTFFAAFYAPIGWLCLMLIRDMGTPEQGFLLTLSIMLMVWGSDIFAYFGGKTFGKHQLAPHISPNKTWEGFFSGYFGAFAGIALVLFAIPLASPLTLLQSLPFVLLVGTFGPVGDLIESKIKRKAKVKDSSTLLPGHGGFFDRFDALILAAPAGYIYLKALEQLGYVAL